MNPNRLIPYALAATLIIGALVRFDGITRVGIRFDDEGAYAGDARLWHRCASLAFDSHALNSITNSDKAALQRHMDDIGIDFGARYTKPSQGFTFLAAGLMFLTGDQPTTLHVLNALTGTCSIALVYLLGARLLSSSVGLIAALLLALSPYHVFYSRSALTETTAGCFVLAGVLLWCLRRRLPRTSSKYTYGSALCLGIAITCHYRMLVVPAVLLILDLFQQQPVKDTAETASIPPKTLPPRFLYVLCLALPALGIETVFLAARFGAWISDSYLPLASYFESAWNWFGLVLATGQSDLARDGSSSLDHLVTYGTYLVHWNGWPLTAISVVGLFLILRVTEVAKAPALIVLVMLGLLALQPYAVARSLVILLPFVSFCAAWLIVRISTGVAKSPVGYAIATVLLLALCLYEQPDHLIRTRRANSSVAEACDFLFTQNSSTAIVGVDTYHRSKYWLYLEHSGIDLLTGSFHKQGTPEAVLGQWKDEGVDWVILDPQRWHFRDAPHTPRERAFLWWEQMEALLASQGNTVERYPHLSRSRWAFLADGPGLKYLEQMKVADAGPIRIYDLRAIREKSHSVALDH